MFLRKLPVVVLVSCCLFAPLSLGPSPTYWLSNQNSAALGSLPEATLSRVTLIGFPRRSATRLLADDAGRHPLSSFSVSSCLLPPAFICAPPTTVIVVPPIQMRFKKRGTLLISSVKMLCGPRRVHREGLRDRRRVYGPVMRFVSGVCVPLSEYTLGPFEERQDERRVFHCDRTQRMMMWFPPRAAALR